ncbi:MAG: DUF2934 domain-containing protein [Deltaproteobacteria bacterium]|nr:DUF2934 domain-containing protein [Deltaproteobacteria bacterium]
MAEVSKLKIPKKRAKSDQKTIHELIEKKAYEIYGKRGGEHGKDLDDWFEAEKMVKGKKKT